MSKEARALLKKINDKKKLLIFRFGKQSMKKKKPKNMN